MTGYAIALFVHITGALGIFAALSLEWTGLRQIGNAAAPEQVREWMGILKRVRKVGFVSMLAAVITGFYMMAIVWRGAAWIYVTLWALVLMIVLAQALTSPRMAVIGKAMTDEKGMLSQTFYGLAKNPLLWVSIQTRAGIALGIERLLMLFTDSREINEVVAFSENDI